MLYATVHMHVKRVQQSAEGRPHPLTEREERLREGRDRPHPLTAREERLREEKGRRHLHSDW
jgi:hypothetical protein